MSLEGGREGGREAEGGDEREVGEVGEGGRGGREGGWGGRVGRLGEGGRKGWEGGRDDCYTYSNRYVQ